MPVFQHLLYIFIFYFPYERVRKTLQPFITLHPSYPSSEIPMLRKSLPENFPSMGKLGTTKLYLSDFVHSGAQIGEKCAVDCTKSPAEFVTPVSQIGVKYHAAGKKLAKSAYCGFHRAHRRFPQRFFIHIITPFSFVNLSGKRLKLSILI